MGFLEELTAPDTASSRCSIAQIKAKLSAEEQRALLTALVSDLPSSTLATRLTKLGHPISASSVLRHRKAQCRCSAGFRDER